MSGESSEQPTCLCGRPACDGVCCIPELDYRAACLSDSEIRVMLTVLLREWRLRCISAEQAPPVQRYN